MRLACCEFLSCLCMPVSCVADHLSSVTICSAVRLPTILKWGKTANPTYDYARLAIWSLLEMMTGIICACFPGLAGLLRRVWPKVFATTKGSNGSNPTYETGNRNIASTKSPKTIFSKTTVSIAFAERGATAPDSGSTRSDEMELTPHTNYKQHENYLRYSAESERNADRHC